MGDHDVVLVGGEHLEVGGRGLLARQQRDETPSGASQVVCVGEDCAEGVEAVGAAVDGEGGSLDRKSPWISARRGVGTWGRYATARSTRPASSAGSPSHQEP